ncbi:SIMPL domain-containing protein [Patescibacteria group bacterium]|nr:SIMPL domain-containing protein [Patescibacteria group bacterium]MBU1952919.1 SIMPL domain-containing protein [Patescibacteria group bacterium]
MEKIIALCRRHIRLVIFLATSLLVLCIVYYLFYKCKTVKTITVIGSAQSQVSNQIATFSVSVDIQNKDKQLAVDEAAARANEIAGALSNFGIPDKDILTQNMNIYQNQDPYYEKGTTVYKPGDWHANYSISITLRDLTKSDALTALLVKFEKTTMYGPNLTIDQTQVDEASILVKAIVDAKTKAEKIAKAGGKKLGEVISIVEGSNYNGSVAYGDLKGFGGGGGGLPIETGSTTVSKTVTVTFRLK